MAKKSWARGLLYVLAMVVLGPGCDVARQTTRRLVVDPLQYNRPKNRLLTDLRNHKQSNLAWNDFKYSGDFERGFRRGFVDYLEGGSGEPPILPPRRYWKVDDESPAGHLAIADWFTGYRYGVKAAESSGHRHWVTIPTSLTYQSNIAIPSGHHSGVSADEMDTVLGTPELGTPELVTAELGIPELGTPELGIAELGIPELVTPAQVTSGDSSLTQKPQSPPRTVGDKNDIGRWFESVFYIYPHRNTAVFPYNH